MINYVFLLFFGTASCLFALAIAVALIFSFSFAVYHLVARRG